VSDEKSPSDDLARQIEKLDLAIPKPANRYIIEDAVRRDGDALNRDALSQEGLSHPDPPAVSGQVLGYSAQRKAHDLTSAVKSGLLAASVFSRGSTNADTSRVASRNSAPKEGSLCRVRPHDRYCGIYWHTRKPWCHRRRARSRRGSQRNRHVELVDLLGRHSCIRR
jgi:hypothetical protein